MANVTVSSTIDTLLQSADAAEAKTAISAATAGSVSALSSNALVLSEKEWPIKTVTWATNQTLTYTGGSNAAGDGVVIQANVTTQFVLTVTPTTSTIYRNGASSALAGTISVPIGKHHFVFWTPDDGSTLYMEDTVFDAGDIPISVTPANYTAATPDVESHLAGIDTALASAGGGVLFSGGSASVLITDSTTETSIASGTIPGGTLGTGNVVRFVASGIYKNNSGGGRGFTLRVKYGATTIFLDSTQSSAVATDAAARLWRIEFELCGNGSISAQYMNGWISVGPPNAATTGYGDFVNTTSIVGRPIGGTSAETSTGDLILDVTIAFQAATTLQEWTTYRYFAI